jgi:hypothetical protein
VEISENLFIHNKTRDTLNSDGYQYVNRISGTLTVKNAQNVAIKNNISTGTMQHSWHAYNSTHDGFFGYFLRISKEWEISPLIDNLEITENSLADYVGWMGYISSGTKDMVTGVQLDSNNFYNGGKPFLNAPVKDLAVQIKYDTNATFDDPKLETDQTSVTVPYFNNGVLHGGYANVNAARADLITRYGDAVPPTATVAYEESETAVIATITADENLRGIPGWEKTDSKTYTKTYTENADEAVGIQDLAGNTNTVQVAVASLVPDDTVPPTATVAYEESGTAVTVTITADEDLREIPGWEKIDGKTYTKIYTQNVDETVEIQDLAGNTTTVQIAVASFAPDDGGKDGDDNSDECWFIRFLKMIFMPVVQWFCGLFQ